MNATIAQGIAWLLVGLGATVLAVAGYRTTRRPWMGDQFLMPHGNAWTLVVVAGVLAFVAIPLGLYHLLTGL